MNNFELEYAREQAIRAAYQINKHRGDKSGMEEARSLMRKFLDDIDAKGHAYAGGYNLYKAMREAGNKHIDLCGPIHDPKKTVEQLKELGIDSFTFSSRWSSAVETAWVFQQNGCRLEGLIELNGSDNDWFGTGEREKVHGYLFSIQ